jgi:hypothetical protein
MAPKRSNLAFFFLAHKWINAPKQKKRTWEEELMDIEIVFPTNFHFSHELHDFESKHNFVR